MMIFQYKQWQAFRFKGKRFLSLIAHDGNHHIFSDHFNNYGAWFSIESFKKHYAKDGEGLNLDNPVPDVEAKGEAATTK